MRSIVFILILLAFAAPVSTGETDPTTCQVGNNPKNCNTCIQDANSAATTECYDCKAGYYLSFESPVDGTCTRCSPSKGAAAGNGQSRPVASATSCTQNCDASCAECFGTSGTLSCSKCAANRFAPTYSAGGSTCNQCGAGKTREVSASDLTANEVEANVCLTCSPGCFECKGTASGCTKCAAGYFLSAKAAPTDLVGTCSWCTGGMGKDADTITITASTAATTSAVACTTKCTGSNCVACSKSAPSECLSCGTGFTLDTSTKTCKGASGNVSYVLQIQALIVAFLVTIALM